MLGAEQLARVGLVPRIGHVIMLVKIKDQIQTIPNNSQNYALYDEYLYKLNHSVQIFCKVAINI